jgi:amidase
MVTITDNPDPSESGWRAVALRRRNEIHAAIPKAYMVQPSLLEAQYLIDLPYRCDVMSSRELRITEHTATELLKLLRDGTYTAVEVTTAFCKRAAIAHQAVCIPCASKSFSSISDIAITDTGRIKTNCIAGVLFKDALEDAAALDEYMAIHGKPKGPLHGLPISVKEHIHLTDTTATSGFIAWADSYSQEDALIVKIFREAGAVFHVKTTNPQALLVGMAPFPLCGLNLTYGNLARKGT